MSHILAPLPDDIGRLDARDQPVEFYPHDDGSECYALLRSAQAFLEKDDDLNAIETCNTALKCLATSTTPQTLEAWAFCIKAIALSSVGLREEAMELGRTVLSIAKQLKDKHLEARAYFAIGLVGLDTGDLDEAKVVLELSLKAAQEADSKVDIFWASNNLSHIEGETAEAAQQANDKHTVRGAVARQFELAKSALDAAQRTGRWRHRCYALLNLAGAYFMDGNDDEAERLVKAYGSLAREGGNLRLMAYASIDQARILKRKGHIRQAIDLLSHPKHLDELCRTDDLKLRTLETIARYYKLLEDYRQALEYFEKARAAEARLKQFKSDRHINYLTAVLETEEAKNAQQRLEAAALELEMRNRLLEIEREYHKQQANLDSLTNLGNRRAANASLERELRRAPKENRGFQVCYADIDHFKQVNDTFGHDFGDAVLVQVSRILEDGLRGDDEIYRFGGEEFMIVLRSANNAAREVCERLRRSIEDFDWSNLHSDLKVTASFGVADWTGESTLVHLLRRADKALYAAKKSGRNQVAFAQ